MEAAVRSTGTADNGRVQYAGRKYRILGMRWEGCQVLGSGRPVGVPCTLFQSPSPGGPDDLQVVSRLSSRFPWQVPVSTDEGRRTVYLTCLPSRTLPRSTEANSLSLVVTTHGFIIKTQEEAIELKLCCLLACIASLTAILEPSSHIEKYSKVT